MFRNVNHIFLEVLLKILKKDGFLYQNFFLEFKHFYIKLKKNLN